MISSAISGLHSDCHSPLNTLCKQSSHFLVDGSQACRLPSKMGGLGGASQ